VITLDAVLVPTDFSEASEVALRYGREFAERFGAALHLVHVVQNPGAQPWAVETYGLSLAMLERQWLQEAHARLEELLPPTARAAVRAQVATILGHPVVEILRYAEAHGANLIVMGTHGRGPLGHMIMGSVAERIVRKAPCPVLTVRHPERGFVVPDS